MKKYSRQYSESGIVLIALLWIFIALSAIVLSFARESHVEVVAASNSQSLEQAYYVARAGISETIYRLMYRQYSPQTQQNALQDEPTPLDLGRVTGEFGGGHYTVDIQDETGKVDLNTVSEEQLRNLLVAAMIPAADVDIIADSIMDWRDTDDSSLENGAEDDYYQTLSPPYSAKNGSFEAVEELLLVRGVTPEYFYGRPERADDGSVSYKYGLSRYFTVYSNRNQINVNFAPLPVLLSIPGMSRETAESIFARRQTKPFENTQEISGESVGMLGATTTQYLTVQTSNTYSLTVSASMDNSKVRRVIRTVVNLDSGQQDFYRILYWNENVPDYVSIPGL